MRRNISLPADLDAAARAAGINVSAIAQKALEDELAKRARWADLGVWLDELDEIYGPPSAEAKAEAEAWISNRISIPAPNEVGAGDEGSSAEDADERPGSAAP